MRRSVAPGRRRAAEILAALALCFAVSGVARAQGAIVSVDVGIGVAGPGEQAGVPVRVAVGESTKVGKIVIEVVFPRKDISFNSAAKGAASRSSDMEIVAEVMEKGDEGVLRLSVSSSDPIPPGDVVELKFDVPKKAQPNSEYSLKNISQKVQTLTGEALASRGADGFVTVIGDAVFSCFFYMH